MSKQKPPVIFKVVLALGLAMALTGCSLLGGPRLDVPGEFTGKARADWPADPNLRTDFYRTNFPMLPKIHILGQFVAHSRLTPDSDPFDCSFFALNRDRLRMRILLPNGTKMLTDLMIDQGVMVIKLPEDGLVFRGPIANGETPFGRQYGIEPWNLIPVFRIGQILADESFKARKHWRTVRLTPQNGADADGLKRIDLDRRSGLPRMAVWESAGGKEFEVQYLKWDYFADRGDSGLVRLMPAEFEVSSRSTPGSLRVTLPNEKNWGYYFGDRIPPMIFRMRMDPGLQVYPLDRFDEVLDQ